MKKVTQASAVYVQQFNDHMHVFYAFGFPWHIEHFCCELCWFKGL